VAGKEAVYEVTSRIGQKLIKFAQLHDTFVVSTKYDHKETPKLYLLKLKQVRCISFN